MLYRSGVAHAHPLAAGTKLKLSRRVTCNCTYHMICLCAKPQEPRIHAIADIEYDECCNFGLNECSLCGHAQLLLQLFVATACTASLTPGEDDRHVGMTATLCKFCIIHLQPIYVWICAYHKPCLPRAEVFRHQLGTFVGATKHALTMERSTVSCLKPLQYAMLRVFQFLLRPAWRQRAEERQHSCRRTTTLKTSSPQRSARYFQDAS